jgi:hypothetical protein
MFAGKARSLPGLELFAPYYSKKVLLFDKLNRFRGLSLNKRNWRRAIVILAMHDGPSTLCCICWDEKD